MVKAELHYNPYSLHTEVGFNGRKPRINSLVEKYIEGKLEDWVDQIPEIFCGEMNGYGFELDFSGTSLDFEELKRSFQLAGVDEKQVFLFLKNELEARETKLAEIRSMFDWLNQNRNEKFDFDSFKIKYPEIFDRTINLDLINGPFLSTSTINGMEISVDNISELSELDETNLSETPIVFWVDADRLVEFQKNLTTILSRKDIDQGQLFFKFADNVDPEKVYRIIEDIGVEHPQIVDDVIDEQVKKYVILYPVTNYIHHVLTVFRKYQQDIKETLEKEQQESKISNSTIHNRMEEYSHKISVFKECLNKFENRDNMAMPESWMINKQDLMSHINRWRSKRTLTSDEYDASRYAREFDELVKLQYNTFIEIFTTTVQGSRNIIDTTLDNWYKPASEISEFSHDNINFEWAKAETIPSIENQLLSIKEEKTVMVKGIFDKTEHPERVVNFYLQKWRDYADGVILPAVEKLQNQQFQNLCEYYDRVSNAFIDHLHQMINEDVKMNNDIAAHLSKEEKKLQEDIDWFNNLSDQLEAIERN